MGGLTKRFYREYMRRHLTTAGKYRVGPPTGDRGTRPSVRVGGEEQPTVRGETRPVKTMAFSLLVRIHTLAPGGKGTGINPSSPSRVGRGKKN